LPERLAQVLLAAQKQFNFSHILAASSAVSRGVLPRVAAKLDVSPISDIVGVKDADTFVRTVYAGNAVMTLKSNDPIKIITVRTTAFDAASTGGSAAEEKMEVPGDLPKNSEFIGQELSKSDRPELASAKVRLVTMNICVAA
jgi:electron transfer flavoprotein alpha subunit